MKKVVFIFVALIFSFTINAQDETSGDVTSKGGWVIEVNTGTWATGNTAFSLFSTDGSTFWSIGAEAGYFVIDDLAIKVGLGYQDADIGDGIFTYKIGAKYYIDGQFPVGADFTGLSSDGTDASWVGLQAGYAWFVADRVSIEPTLRYNLTLDELKAESAFQGLIGFAFYF